MLFGVCGCKNVSSYRQFSGSVWHTVYHITYKSDRQLDDSILAVMRRVELSLSPFDSASVISAVNRNEPVKADSLIRRVFAATRSVWEQSGGAFDPTVAPLVNLWGFGWTGDGGGHEPSEEAIDSVLQAVGFDECYIADGGRVVKKSPETMFNFSAITKGLGCDEVGAMLRRNGCDDYMVEIGGEIAVNGRNPRGKAWHLMVDAPQACDTAVVHSELTMVDLTSGGIATSGNYRNYRDTEGGRVGHTINPVTGRPQASATLSATVVAPSCMLADAYATACMVLPADSAIAMINRAEGVEVLIVVGDDAENMTLLTSDGW